MYKSNSAEVYQFYSSYNSLSELFEGLEKRDFENLQVYLKAICRYRVETVIKNAQNGYFYRGAQLDKNDLCYYVEDCFGREEKISEQELRERIKTNSSMMISIAQSALLEVKYVAYLMISNSREEYMKTYYKNIENILKLRADLVKRETDVCIGLIKKLYMEGLALPKFLVDYYNSKLVCWYKNRCVINRLATLGIDENTASKMMISKLKLIGVANTIIQESSQEEYRDQLAKLIILFYSTYMRVTGNEKRNIEKLADMSMREVFNTHGKNGDRLSTKGEVELKVAGVFKVEKYFLEKEKRNKLLWLTYYSTGNKRYLRELGILKSMYDEFDDEAFLSETKNLKILEGAFQYLKSSKFMQEDSRDLLEGGKEIEYLETAEDEIHDIGLIDKLNSVIKMCGGSRNEYDKVAVKIAKYALERKKFNLTAKQVRVINICYENHSKISENNTTLYNEALEVIKELQNLHKYRTIDFMYKFIAGIKKYKRCSPKQLELLKSELAEFRKNSDIEIELEAQDMETDLDKYVGNEKTAELDALLKNRESDSEDNDFDLDDVSYTSEDDEDDFDDLDVDLEDLKATLKDKYRKSKVESASDIGLDESNLYESETGNKRRKAPLLNEIDTTKLVF